ncbi:MAG: biotin--[acetyl-CoA-carboxylase] ligase [Verrucomicrobia bacterium]|nr:biotin--[acetyl-CoA-carboxylase] ligase [Verrucomicrobiota bacterium]
MTESLRLRMLRLLASPFGKAWAPAELAGKAEGSEAEAAAALEALREDGWLIKFSGDGVSCAGEPPWLNPEAVELHLQTKCLGRPLVVYHETSSTNDRARQAAQGGAAEGLTIFAESQTSGRGQHGRRWLSPPGTGLWFTVLLRSTLPVENYPQLVQAAALSTAEVLDRYLAVPVLIKRPNDLYVGPSKLAGFLLESASDATWQVLGFGINVHAAPDLPGAQITCVDKHANSPPVARARLAAEILYRFETWYRRGNAHRLEDCVRARQWERTGMSRPDLEPPAGSMS